MNRYFLIVFILYVNKLVNLSHVILKRIVMEILLQQFYKWVKNIYCMSMPKILKEKVLMLMLL